MQIWIRYLRTGLSFQQSYKATASCKKSPWTGSAFTIGGGYTWEDVYPLAATNNVVVVGGGTPVSVSLAESTIAKLLIKLSLSAV